ALTQPPDRECQDQKRRRRQVCQEAEERRQFQRRRQVPRRPVAGDHQQRPPQPQRRGFGGRRGRRGRFGQGLLHVVVHALPPSSGGGGGAGTGQPPPRCQVSLPLRRSSSSPCTQASSAARWVWAYSTSSKTTRPICGISTFKAPSRPANCASSKQARCC